VGAATALTAAAYGCGAGGDANADPATVAPRGSTVYLAATVRPDGDQKQAVDRIGRMVFRVSDPGTRIQQLVDRSFKRNRDTRNVSYADDVEPWLGKRAAVVVVRLAGANRTAAIFAAKDTGEAEELVDRVANEARPRWLERSYRGVDYRFDPSDASGQGVVGDYLVAGDGAAFRAVVDAFKTGQGLTDQATYRGVAAAARGKLGFGYIDLNRTTAGLSARGALPAGLLRSLTGVTTPARPVTLSLSARPDRVTVEAVVRGAKSTAAADGSTRLVGQLPGDSWLALGLPRVGRSLRRALARAGGGAGGALVRTVRRAVRTRTGLDLDRDLLPALGDTAFFARGSSLLSVGAGLVVATPDPAATRRVLGRLRQFVQREAANRGVRTTDASIAGAHGFNVTSPQLPGAVDVVIRGDRLVAAYGEAATREALGATDHLAGAPEYRAAQDSLDGVPPAMFLSFAPVAGLVGTQTGPGAQRASAYLSALRTLAVGSRAEGDRRTGRIVVTVR